MSTFKTLLTDEIGVAGRPASALTDAINTEADLVDYLTDDESVSDFDGVGRRTASKVMDWYQDEYPEKNRERMERSESYCMEYTTDHGIPEDERDPDTTYFAFICPRCESKNPLKGDPENFANRPFACTTCRWVPLLEGTAIGEFADEMEVPA